MSIEKTKNILRMLKLAGREEEIIPEIYSISDENEIISETEWKDLPTKMKAVIEGKKHVLSYADNQFQLKPIKTDGLEDGENKSAPNKTSEYEKDGGDAEKANKKMLDNNKNGGAEMVKESDNYDTSRSINESDGNDVGSVSPWQRENADTILKHKRANFELEKDKSPQDYDDEERLKAKEEREARERKAEELLKKSRLANAKLKNDEDVAGRSFNEQFENPQQFDDQEAEEYYGLDRPREDKVSIPKSVTQAINSRIREIEASIGEYDDKGYNDGAGANSNKNKAIEALEQIKDNLSTRDYEGFREAQLFFLTLMSPITDLFPTEVVTFLKRGRNDEPNIEFGDEVEPFETSLKESYMFSRQDAFNRYFVQEVLPEVVKQYGYNDKPAINQAYNDTLDNLEKDGLLPSKSRSWTLPDNVVNNPERYISESVKVIVEYGTDVFNEDNTAVETWFERDRQYVGLYPKDDEGKPDTNKKPIVEWWDEDVTQAIEDGFLDPRDWHGSALEYARHVGIIKEDKSSYSLKKILENKKKKSRKKDNNPCWDGYEMVGMKKDERGNEVPNCVPKEDLNENKDYETKRGRQPQEQGDVEESHTVDWKEVRKAAEDAAKDIFGKVDKNKLDGIVKDTKREAEKDSSMNTKDAVQIAVDKMRASNSK